MAIATRAVAETDRPVSWFSTSGETIYHLQAARTDTAVQRSVVAASYSGKVLCFDFGGTKLWRVSAGEAFIFDLDVGDIDNDGLDECVVASADGSLYIIDHDGHLLDNVLDGGPPLYAVKLTADPNNEAAIVCGGSERVLYRISSRGEVVDRVMTQGAIEHLDTGCLFERGRTDLVVGIALPFRRGLMAFYQLPDLTSIGRPRKIDQTHYDMVAADTDGDQIDEIAIGGELNGIVLDRDGNRLYEIKKRRNPRGQHAYSMLLLEKIRRHDGHGTELIGRFASSLRRYRPDGSVLDKVALEFSPANLSLDPVSKTLLLGSGISGGDCIYLVRMSEPGWRKELSRLGYRGKLAQIVSNLETLAAQVAGLQPPFTSVLHKNREHTSIRKADDRCRVGGKMRASFQVTTLKKSQWVTVRLPLSAIAGWIDLKAVDRLDFSTSAHDFAPGATVFFTIDDVMLIAQQGEGAAAATDGSDLPLLLQIDPMKHARFDGVQVPATAAPREAIRGRVCRGEVEHYAFILNPKSDLCCVTVTWGDLKGPDGSLPAETLDARIAKVWWVARLDDDRLGSGDYEDTPWKLWEPARTAEVLAHTTSPRRWRGF